MKTAIRSLVTSAIVLILGVSLGMADTSSRENVLPTTEVEPIKSLSTISLVGEIKSGPAAAQSGATPMYKGPALSSSESGGDVNLNGVPNEIADAVMYSTYFMYGLQVFRIDEQAQIMETDINADGLTLSVSDLVYQINIINQVK